VDFPHQGADQSFHDPAVVGLASGAVLQVDAVFLAAPAQGLAVELGCVVDVELGRFPGHRPRGLGAHLLEPDPLVGDHMRQAQAHRRRRRSIEGDHHPDHGPRDHIDPDRHVGPADRGPLLIVDHDQVDQSVVDLDLLEQLARRRRGSARGAQRSCRLCPLPSERGRPWVELGDARARRSRPPPTEAFGCAAPHRAGPRPARTHCGDVLEERGDGLDAHSLAPGGGRGGDPGRGDALAEVDRFATDASRDAPIARRNPAAKTGVPGSRVAPGCRGADRGANWSRPRPEEQLKHPTAEP